MTSFAPAARTHSRVQVSAGSPSIPPTDFDGSCTPLATRRICTTARLVLSFSHSNSRKPARAELHHVFRHVFEYLRLVQHDRLDSFPTEVEACEIDHTYGHVLVGAEVHPTVGQVPYGHPLGYIVTRLSARLPLCDGSPEDVEGVNNVPSCVDR